MPITGVAGKSGRVEFRSATLHRWLVPQKVRGLSLAGEQLHLHTQNGSIALDLHSVALEATSDWLVLSKITLRTPLGNFTIGGLPGRPEEMLREAVTEAKRRHRFRTALTEEWPQFAAAHDTWNQLATAERYLADSSMRAWRLPHLSLPLPTGPDADLVSVLEAEQQTILATLRAAILEPDRTRQERNAAFVKEELARFQSFFDGVERFPLTEPQRLAVIRDEDNALVVAGAGTGKTSTIMAKVGYLLTKGLARPEELLLLAFTRKAADEMRERIKTKFGVELPVRTFHALGLEILAKAEGRKPSLCREAEDLAALRSTLSALVEELLADATFKKRYVAFHGKLKVPYRSAWEFKTEEEYRNYLLDVEPRGLSGLRYRSYEECELANWFLLNGIRCEYERPYEVDTATSEHRQYKPDFYLPDHGIYLEHWGLDRDGRTPPFMDQRAYTEKRAWAKALHAEHGTTLLETFSWEKQEGVLLSNLEAKLREKGAVPGSGGLAEGLRKLREAGVEEPFATLCGTFQTHFKGGGHTLAELRRKAAATLDPERASLFLDLFEAVHQGYQERLRARGEVDFEDMVTLAVAHAQSGRYTSPFRYLLVDEFQDLSQGRARLLEALRRQVPHSRLFCVGDDWQSIYRFSGSDLALMTRFEERFGPTQQTRLDRTFRFDRKLAEFSSRFVLQNPAQIRKILNADDGGEPPAVELRLRQEGSASVAAVLSELPAGCSVFVLTRYRFNWKPSDRKQLKDRFPHLRLEFHTAHASKGLEADYVLLDQLCAGKYGFPSEIEDDPVLNLVLAEPDRYPHGEERRLFYVALTRARKRVYLLSDPERESVFVHEIRKDDGYEKRVPEEMAAVMSSGCPECGRGRIERRESRHGVFYSCSKLPLCEYKEQPCHACRRGRIRIEDGTARCEVCSFTGRQCQGCGKGYLVRRPGGSGRPAFLGCSRFRREGPSCRYTEPLRTSTAGGRSG